MHVLSYNKVKYDVTSSMKFTYKFQAGDPDESGESYLTCINKVISVILVVHQDKTF